MDKEFIMATAKTIEQQILWSINKWEYLSWGISKKVAIEYEGMATLALRVSGAVHKGWVFISLNEGMDCYEVRLLNVARTKVKRTLEEVYCDNLGEVLDGLIERKSEWTDEQYKNKAARDSARKMGVDVIGVSKPKTEETMANNEVKFRPATMAEIEGRDTDLYMDGEQVWVMMIHRSETIGEGEPKLDYIMLTNMKKVQVEDLQVIDNNNNEPEEETTMATTKKNETENVQTAAQVTNNETIDVNVGEVTVDSIMPVMQPVEEKPAVTVPLGEHGTLVVGGVPKPKKSEDKPKVTLKTKTPQPKTAVLPAVRFVTYKTKKGADAPMIVGFGGDDDPRWKNLFDAKPKWVSAGYRRDTDGNQVHHLMFGTKYMAVAKALCDAYNTDDRKAWEAAEKACADNYSGIVAGYQAEKAARKAEKAAKKPSAKAEKPAAPAMSADDAAMFELFKKFMAGDKEAMAKVGAVLNKAA